MLPGADLRQALQAGLWEALADCSDRAAVRATCRDARDMADALHDTAVLPVGPGIWDSAARIAAYHRQLGAVRSVHVVYSGGTEDEARAVRFMEAYSTALGAALPAADCSIEMTYGQPAKQLPATLAAVLLQRVVPRVERLDMALSSYDRVEQLLQALEPCERMCSLRLLPVHNKVGPSLGGLPNVMVDFRQYPGALDALCRLPRLHTLSGPWVTDVPSLQRLCDALPSLTTLGFKGLFLDDAPGACISRRLHTLAAWCHSAGDDSLQLDRPWHLQNSACWVAAPHNLQTALPAVHRLEALVLTTWGPHTEELSAMQAAAQRFAACAERWAWAVDVAREEELQVLRGLSSGSLAGLKHLDVSMYIDTWVPDPDLIEVASALGSLVSSAPNISTLAMCCTSDTGFGGPSPQALMATMQPFRRAAHLHTIWLYGDEYNYDGMLSAAAGQAALMEGMVRCLARPGAEGGDEYSYALQHVRLHGALPGALAACRAALARDGSCVSVGTGAFRW